jgi:LPS O-antigen subunit length determinant protein (WzzB/FepE family)
MVKEIDKESMRKRLGNIAQLQELLFGEYIERYNRRLDLLESELNKLQKTFTENLTQIQESFDRKLNTLATSFEQKLESSTLKTQIETQKIQQEIQTKTKINEETLNFLQNNFNLQNKFLKEELLQTRETLQADRDLLKQQLFNKMEQNLLELNTTKLSHKDLAEILFDLSLKLKGSHLLTTEFKNEERDNNNNSLLLNESREN